MRKPVQVAITAAVYYNSSWAWISLNMAGENNSNIDKTAAMTNKTGRTQAMTNEHDYDGANYVNQ